MAAAEKDQELHRAARAGPASNLQTMLANPQLKRLVNTRDGYEAAVLLAKARSRRCCRGHRSKHPPNFVVS